MYEVRKLTFSGGARRELKVIPLRSEYLIYAWFIFSCLKESLGRIECFESITTLKIHHIAISWQTNDDTAQKKHTEEV